MLKTSEMNEYILDICSITGDIITCIDFELWNELGWSQEIDYIGWDTLESITEILYKIKEIPEKFYRNKISCADCTKDKCYEEIQELKEEALYNLLIVLPKNESVNTSEIDLNEIATAIKKVAYMSAFIMNILC